MPQASIANSYLKAAPAPLVPPPSLEKSKAFKSERKWVTVLFGDISGFTAMSEKLDPEKLTDLMNTCFARLGKHVTSLDGYIDKFIGDCIMVLFGAPQAHENDPELAVLCARRMREELQLINEELGLELGMSFGINSGPVLAGYVGSDGKQDYTAMGDSVNIAQRLQSSAQKGQILVSANVMQACAKSFHFRPLPSIMVKGKSDALAPYEVIETSEVTLHQREVQKKKSSIIGRERELLIVERLINETHSSKGQILLLCGEPGVGKTRLKEEIQRQAEQYKTKWIEARASSLQQETPFYSLHQVIAECLELRATDSAHEKKQKVASHLWSSDLQLKIMTEFFDLEDSGLALTAAQKRPILFQAIRDLLLKKSESHPIILYFEDIHWLDPLSQECIEFLMSGIGRMKLGIFASARRDHKHEWGMKENFNQINLTALSKEDTGRVIANILETPVVSDDLLELVFKKAEGNPLFIEEILRSLIDRQMLQKVCDSWELISPSSEIEIPGSVQGLIASRIDRLPAPAKRTLQIASVLGRQFPLSLLSRIATEDEQVSTSLETLKAKDLIIPLHSIGEDLVYTFNHALTQDVAYQSCLKKDRIRFHAIAAHLLETLHQEPEYFETLAHHFDEAELWQDAIKYHHMSAKHFGKNYNNAGSISEFERAIAIAEGHPHLDLADETLPELYFGLSDIQVRIGKMEEAAQTQRKLLDLAASKQLKPYIMKSYRRLGDIARMRGDAEEAIDFLQDSLDTAKTIGDLEGELRTVKSLGLAYKLGNRLTEAETLLAEGLERANQLENPGLKAEFHNDLAVTLIALNQFERADHHLQECIRIAEEHSIKTIFISAHINRGVISFFRKDLDNALIHFERSSKVAQSIGDLKNMMSAEHNLGEIKMERGQLSEALRSFEKSLEISRQIGDQFEEANNLTLLGHLLGRLNQYEKGVVELDKAIEISERQKYFSLCSDAYRYKAEHLLHKGDFNGARELAERSRSAACEIHNEILAQKAEDFLDKLRQKNGKRALS